jgi:hypothetical protein
MGAKYQPNIKDQKANQRFHQNARRAAASGPVKKSLYLISKPKPPIDSGIGASKPKTQPL